MEVVLSLTSLREEWRFAWILAMLFVKSLMLLNELIVQIDALKLGPHPLDLQCAFVKSDRAAGALTECGLTPRKFPMGRTQRLL